MASEGLREWFQRWAQDLMIRVYERYVVEANAMPSQERRLKVAIARDVLDEMSAEIGVKLDYQLTHDKHGWR